MKGYHPKYLSFFSAILISVVQIIVLVLIPEIHLKLKHLIFLFIFNFLVIFLTFYSVLQKFIYNKIKLIYKSIRTVKSEKNQSNSSNLLQDVEREVAAWKKKQAEEIHELKKMEKFRREYIGNVSHELKTPIFNIQGYLETLMEMPDRSNKIFDKFLKKALENTERLNTIIQDLQMIAKNETEGLDLFITTFNIRELIEQVYDELEIIAQKNKVQLTFKQGKCPGYLVKADRERIHQVLTNLISNAIKYNKKNGKVIASCYEMDDHILVEITDTGIGIKQKHLPRLFERFYRVDKNRSRKKGGSGLGLAIVKHILEAHNQRVHVRSSIGIGTTFGFTLEKA